MAEHYCLFHWRVAFNHCGYILAEAIDGSQWQFQEIDFQKYLARNGLLDWQLNYADHE